MPDSEEFTVGHFARQPAVSCWPGPMTLDKIRLGRRRAEIATHPGTRRTDDRFVMPCPFR